MTVAIGAAGIVVRAPLAMPPGVTTAIVPETAPPPLDHLPEAIAARAARVERIGQLVLAAAGLALASPLGVDRARAGIVLGTAFGCLLTNAAHQRRLLAEGPPGASPRLFAATVSNAAAGELAIAYELAGPAVTISAGGASGVLALAHAAEQVESGAADAVIAGGADALGEPLQRWLAAAAIPVGRPPADGAALLVLRRTPAPPIGWIDGHGSGFEPSPASAGAGDGLAAAIAAACEAAGCGAAEIGVVVRSAPPALRQFEARALARVGVRTGRDVSPKDGLGETFGAAGALGVLAGLAAAGPGERVLVLDACSTGHVGALVARRPG